MEGRSTEVGNRLFGLIGIGKLYEGETTRLAAHSIPHQRGLGHLESRGAEERSDLVLLGSSVEVADK